MGAAGGSTGRVKRMGWHSTECLLAGVWVLGDVLEEAASSNEHCPGDAGCWFVEGGLGLVVQDTGIGLAG